MSGESEAGEGMEPPKSVDNDHSIEVETLEDAVDGFSIVDADRSDSTETPARRQSDQADAETELMPVEQWLAEAEGDETSKVSTDADAAKPTDAKTTTGATSDQAGGTKTDKTSPKDSAAKTGKTSEQPGGTKKRGRTKNPGKTKNGAGTRKSGGQGAKGSSSKTKDRATSDRSEDDTATEDDSGQTNMSDIMAELLAAAESSDAAGATDTKASSPTDKTAASEPLVPEPPQQPDRPTAEQADDSGSAKTVLIGPQSTGATSKAEDPGRQPGKDSPGDPNADQNGVTTDDPKGDETTKPAPGVTAAPTITESKTVVGPGSITIEQPPPPTKSGLSVGTAAKIIVGVVVGSYLLLSAAWAIDMAQHNGEAMRGVEIGDLDVGGLNRSELNEALDGVTGDLRDQPLQVSVGDATIVTDPVTLGLGLDRESMIDESLEARRGGFLPFRPFTWLADLFGTETVEVRYSVDAETARRATAAVINPELDQPVEPTMVLRGSQMTVSPGAPGVVVDADEISDLLPAVIDGGTPYRLDLRPRDFDPELATAAVTAVADEVNELTEQPIGIRVLDEEAQVSPQTVKSWVMLEVDGDEASWTLDEDLALADLKPLFPTLGSEDQQARFSVVDGEPIIVPASETVICCDSGAGPILQRVMQQPIPDPVTEEDDSGDEVDVRPLRTASLQPMVTGFDEGVDELESLGIIEEVSTFTTEHACCQNRVINIQRFADLTQGVVIRPGDEFSLNGFVGRRTRENEFVADGAISLGNFEQQVGGGISQYATTFFNAAFFAGVEFVEYQSHSIYISRYPRGREATISWPKPDLKVRNNTEYGILVWNEYTPTSITVSFYSTKHLEVEALALKRSSDRKCRIDITPRLITYPDGSEIEDRVFALYRPGEGLDCNGDSTTPEEPKAVSPPPTPPVDPDPDPDPDPPPPDDEILPPG